MDNIFKLKGTLKSAEGEAAPGLLVAIVDEDALDDDDLIGVGKTDAAGSFHLSFLGSEFRQDALEVEETPDIKIVVSAFLDGTAKAIFQRSFPDLSWATREVDLGEIVLDGVNLREPVPLPDVAPAPGADKRAAHLHIDDELVRYCLAEVAPLVERLTGWSNLLEGLKVEVAPSLAPTMIREPLIGAGKDPTDLAAKMTAFVTDLMQGPGAGCALYDAHTHTVIFNSSILEQVNLEGLKVMCGHELVHVGQFKYTPGLREYNLAHLRGMIAGAATETPEESTRKMAYMTELEGYAKYIESDFLQDRFYPLALLVYNPSITENVVRAILAAAAPEPVDPKASKAAQYLDGRELYRKRQQGDAPARFQMDVATLYNGAAFAPAAPVSAS
jgi:hypothetical protein